MNQTENQSRIDEAEKFFNLLFGSVTDKKFSYLWTLPDKKTYPFDVSTPDNRHAMAQKAIKLSNAGFDVYFGTNVTDAPPVDGNRAKAKDISAIVATICDIDTLGGKHNDTEKYPPDFATAKSFLPFDVSLAVNSGYGFHGYCLYSEPLTIDDTNRESAVARNKKFLDVIRSRAGKFAKAVDAVQDLARVLRVPGTCNYKLGISADAPICHIVGVTDCLFVPSVLDQKLNALLTAPKTSPARQLNFSKTDKLSNPAQIDSPEFDNFRVAKMLDVTPVGYLHGQDWFTVMTVCKNRGMNYAEWDAMNRGGENYNETQNRARWDSDTNPNIGIGALYNIAVQYGYDAQATAREWFKLHPELKPSRGRKLADDMKRELDDAIIWLKSLTPETFTVADARDKCRSVALAAVFGFHNDVENFFDALKAAKKLAKERLKEDEATNLTQKLPDTVRRALSALTEGVSVDFIRRTIDRKITAVTKERDEYLRQIEIQERKKQAEERRRQREAQVAKSLNRLDELRAMEPSPERDAEMIQLIRDSCEWKCNLQGVRQYVKGISTNTDKIFTLDPNIDGLFGYDDFLQADVFLKSPIWAPKKKRGDEWQDSDDEQLQLYLRRNYGELTNKELIRESFTDYSRQRCFHEVQDYFKSLPQWDGVKRAETLYIDWLKVADTKYAREVTIKHLLAAVARIFNPGCKFYWALVLRGNQKIGKSYVFQRLGGKWYKAISDRVDDPHVIDTLRLVWIGEFKEMSGMRKADVNAIKDFIELSADTRRLAYARRAGTYPRHCVFGITVNDDEFFTDATGNRRFLVLDSPLPKFGYVKEVRGEKLSDNNVIAQIWAEVYHLYNEIFKDGFDDRKLELSPETELEGERIAETYMRDDGLTTEILGYLNTKIPPLIIWQLLSREERRKFFVDGGKIQIEQGDLQARFKNRVGNKYDELAPEFEKACTVREGFLRHFTDKDNRWQLVFYGAEYRQHICAAEVFNECFGADNRKRMPRINEILAHLDGWHLGERLRNADPVYPDQTKPYFRG